MKTVEEILAETEAARWWIDQQIEKGRTDDQIAAELPIALAVITGRIPLDDIVPSLRRTRSLS